MKNSLIIFYILAISSTAFSQKYFTKSAQVDFYSETPIEKIEALNKKGTCVLDCNSGAVEFAVLIKAFQFEKALMQEHFNENYMESNTYPKAVFKGKLKDFDYSKNLNGETQTFDVVGEITIHGVTQPLTTKVNMTFSENTINCTSSFEIEVADFDIKIPSVVKDNIAKVVEVTLNAPLEPLQ